MPFRTSPAPKSSTRSRQRPPFAAFRPRTGVFTISFCSSPTRINRRPPKTQPPLLERDAGARVTTGGRSFPLPQRPFFRAIATQNPIEQEGTYPLPEAQLDRFMFLVRMDYPEREEEIQILRRTTANRDVQLARLIDGPGILALQRLVREIPVSEHVFGYCIDLVRMTRPGEPNAPDFVKANLIRRRAAAPASTHPRRQGVGRPRSRRSTGAATDIRETRTPSSANRIACNFHAAGDGRRRTRSSTAPRPRPR
jgi:MoxR-like ATPase